jgi:hypothetical protein
MKELIYLGFENLYTLKNKKIIVQYNIEYFLQSADFKKIESHNPFYLSDLNACSQNLYVFISILKLFNLINIFLMYFLCTKGQNFAIFLQIS